MHRVLLMTLLLAGCATPGIQGTVTDQHGKPVPDALITVMFASRRFLVIEGSPLEVVGPVRHTVTDEQGHFTVEGTAKGSGYKLIEVKKEGYCAPVPKEPRDRCMDSLTQDGFVQKHWRTSTDERTESIQITIQHYDFAGQGLLDGAAYPLLLAGIPLSRNIGRTCFAPILDKECSAKQP